MRRKLLSLFAVTLLTTSLSAQSYNFLTFKDHAGADTSLSIDGLKITFSNGSLIASTSEGNKTFSLENLQSMLFTLNDITGISPVTQTTPITKIDGRTLYVKTSKGTPIELFDLTGRHIESTIATETTNSISLTMPQGIYLIKVGNVTSKIQVK